MDKLRKIIFIFLILLIILAGAVYIDYFITKTRNTYPKLAIKKEVNKSEVVYNAVLYRVWHCKDSEEYIIGGYKDVDAVCPLVYTYEDGYYKNAAGIKISEKDLELIKTIYNSEIIETFNSEQQISNAVYVASEYGKRNYEVVMIEDRPVLVGKYKLINMSEYMKNDEGKYEWIINVDIKYCLKGDSEYAPYENETCGKFKKIVYESKWCSLYENSALAYNEEINKKCSGQ